MQTEQEMHDQLIEYFTGLDADADDPVLDPEGKFSFVVVAFCKPTNPAAFISAGKGGAIQRGDTAAAVGTGLEMVSPDVTMGDDGLVTADSVLKQGINALCCSMTSRFLSEVALNQVVGQSQMAIRKREGSFDA